MSRTQFVNTAWDRSLIVHWRDLILILNTFTLCRFLELRNSSFRCCAFSHCDFRQASVEGTSFVQCTYDLATSWPDGFVPEDHGLQLSEGELERMERKLVELKARQP